MNTIKTLCIAAALGATGAIGSAALAQAPMDHGKMGGMKMADGAAAEMSEAEVRKVDKEQGKLTLKHGPIKSLDMPGMTMVFTVKDKALLDTVKAGDKVKFRASNEGGKMTVLEMVPMK